MPVFEILSTCALDFTTSNSYNSIRIVNLLFIIEPISFQWFKVISSPLPALRVCTSSSAPTARTPFYTAASCATAPTRCVFHLLVRLPRRQDPWTIEKDAGSMATRPRSPRSHMMQCKYSPTSRTSSWRTRLVSVLGCAFVSFIIRCEKSLSYYFLFGSDLSIVSISISLLYRWEQWFIRNLSPTLPLLLHSREESNR